jgi:hypothetical protein
VDETLDQLTLLPEDRPPTGKPPIAAPDIKKLPLLDVWELKHHPRNVRQHNLNAIVESLRTYGQQSPIVVQRSTGYVCKGNGTLRAARDVIGWAHIYGSVEDFDDETALRYLLADNRSSDTAQNDKAALGALLKELDAGSAGLQGTLFSIDDAEDVWAEMGQISSVIAPTDAAYAESEEELAQRLAAKRSDTAGTLKEVVLVLSPADYETFALTVSKLSRAYGTQGVRATVMEAIRRAGEQVVA